jgi:membrane-associated phospholipid phosphatase
MEIGKTEPPCPPSFRTPILSYPTRHGKGKVYCADMNLANLLSMDAKISQKLRVAEREGPLRRIALVIGHTGDSWYWGLLLLGVILFAVPEYKHWAIISLIAVFIGAAIVLTIKFTFKRRRPEGDMGQIYRKTDPHSFPSGHAVRSLMLGVIALGIAPSWLGNLLIIWAPLVGIARVMIGVHYISDVIAGWVLGILFGLITIWASGILPSIL